VPPETLPALLGLGKKGLRLLALAVIGERGRWLAGHNPAWAYAVGWEDIDEAWQIGAREERSGIVERLRSSDPQHARQLVQSTWEQDPPEDRAEFVTAFLSGLSMEDEPFLETCLDDRRREVREAALDLLVRLPDSALVRRMRARLDPLLTFKPRRLGGDLLEANLPEELEAAAKRDGVTGSALRKGMGAKASQLAQMLALVPPDTWSRKWDRPPEKLLPAALNSEWKESFILGWLQATARCGDPDWAGAFAELWVREAGARAVLAESGLGAALQAVPVQKLEALAQASITPRINELDDRHPLLDLLERYERQWSARLAKTVMASLRRQAGGIHWRLTRALPDFGLRVPVELSGEFTGNWPKEARGWDPYIDQFTAVLSFRREMADALKR